MILKGETLEQLNERHARVAWSVAERAKKQMEEIQARAKEKLFVLRGRHSVDVAQWNKVNKAP